MSIRSQTDMGAGSKITVVRDRQGIDDILAAWVELQNAEATPVPGVDPYHYICELESFVHYAEPYILCLHREGRLEGMLIGRYQTAIMPIRLGYLTLMKPRLRKILVYHGGILGLQNTDVCSLLLRALRKRLRRGDADVAVFNHFHCDSVLHRAVGSEIRQLSLGRFAKIEGHWRMEKFPSCINDFFGGLSRHSRGELKRQIKKLENSYTVHMKVFAGPDNLEEGIAAAASVSEKTYQHALGHGLQDDIQTRSFLFRAAINGWLRLYVIYINNEAAAFEWGIMYRDTIFLRQIGFDPKWRNWSVGTILFLKTLEALCAEGNVRHMDIGFGDAEYKKIYSDTKRDTKSLTVYAERPFPILINILRTSADGVWAAAGFAATKLGLERKIKRLWRNRLGYQ